MKCVAINWATYFLDGRDERVGESFSGHSSALGVP